MYGAEPNFFLHEKLLANTEKAGLGPGKYEVLDCGAEPNSLLPALKKAHVLPPKAQTLPPEGVFDTIIAVKSLCSAPQEQMPATMAIIHGLLKPGGEFLFFEHLQNENDTLTHIFVWFVNLIWPWFMGNCHMNAKLDKVLVGMGGWAERDLKTIGEHKGHEPFRYVRGICRKA
jgi:SAM-dependent methyltransferase